MTRTYSFGSSNRESHDASDFYNRNLYEGWMEETPLDELEFYWGDYDWVDQILLRDTPDFPEIPDNSIALCFTSPPYNVGKEYDINMTFEEYTYFLESHLDEIYRTLMPGGRIVFNVANLGRKPYVALNALIYNMFSKKGLLPMGEIIWQKAKGASGNCAWGSWMSAKSPRLRDIHEYLLVFAKDRYGRVDKGFSTISKEEFMAATLSIWEIQPERAKRVGHPAPFPIDLARRVIELYSYADDVVLDPFGGVMTTCVAAKGLGRHYMGYDNVEEYIEKGLDRLSKTDYNSYIGEHEHETTN